MPLIDTGDFNIASFLTIGTLHGIFIVYRFIYPIKNKIKQESDANECCRNHKRAMGK